MSDLGWEFGGMVRLVLHGSLPFVTVAITHRGQSREVPDVLVDTGSASTVISAEIMARMSVVPEVGDRLRTLRGIGGRELVFTRQIDRFEVGGHGLPSFEVEIGAMDYGFPMNGILGMDFLRQAGAVVDLRNLTLDFRVGN